MNKKTKKLSICMLFFAIVAALSLPQTLNAALTEDQSKDIKKFSFFAQSNRKQNKHREVINNVEKVEAIDPEFTEAKNILLYWKALAYEELKIADSAKATLVKFSTINPMHTGALIKLEYQSFSENKLGEAIEINKKLIDLDSSKVNPEPYRKIGTYFMTLGGEENEKAAMEYLEEYVDLVPDSIRDASIDNLLNKLVNTYRNTEEQITRYSKVLESNPNDFKAMEKLSLLYLKENNIAKAEEFALKIYNKEPENLKIIKRLIKIYANNPAKGISFNQKAIKLEPRNELYNLNLAKYYKEQKNYAQARNNCSEAYSKNPRNKNILRVWGDIFAEAVGTCAKDIEFQDKLVYAIAFGIYEKAGLTRVFNTMRENGQVPAKADIFQSKGVKRPSRGCYSWINNEWDEVKYIDEFLSRAK